MSETVDPNVNCRSRLDPDSVNRPGRMRDLEAIAGQVRPAAAAVTTVAELAGTTRDPVRVGWEIVGEPSAAIDLDAVDLARAVGKRYHTSYRRSVTPRRKREQARELAVAMPARGHGTHDRCGRQHGRYEDGSPEKHGSSDVTVRGLQRQRANERQADRWPTAGSKLCLLDQRLPR